VLTLLDLLKEKKRVKNVSFTHIYLEPCKWPHATVDGLMQNYIATSSQMRRNYNSSAPAINYYIYDLA